MPSYEETRERLLTSIQTMTVGSAEYLNAVKSLETLNKAEDSQKCPETPDATGAKAWFDRHSDALIKVAGTFGTVVTIGFIESKFDVIFRSKASKYL